MCICVCARVHMSAGAHRALEVVEFSELNIKAVVCNPVVLGTKLFYKILTHFYPSTISPDQVVFLENVLAHLFLLVCLCGEAQMVQVRAYGGQRTVDSFLQPHTDSRDRLRTQAYQ